MKKTYQSTLDVKTQAIDVLGDARNLERKGQFAKALELIEDSNSKDTLMLRVDLLLKLGRFEEAVESLDNALSIVSDSEVLAKKADTLYRWAKVSYFPDCNYALAMELADRALEILPEGDDAAECWFLKGEIYQSQELHIDARKCFLKAEGRLEELKALEGQMELFESHKNDTLINVTGVGFYRGLEPFREGTLLDLVSDSKNEHDPDAVAVCLEGEIVGYVANSEYTLINNVKSASEIKAMIHDKSRAEVLFIFQGEFVIARIIS